MSHRAVADSSLPVSAFQVDRCSRVRSDGCQLQMNEFFGPEVDSPAILLVHGSRAHSGWWDEVVPRLKSQYRVFTFDFSGMGDSDFRPSYQQENFVSDLLDVVNHIQTLTEKTLSAIVAHSWGGQITLLAAAQSPRMAEQLLIVDSYIVLPDSTELLTAPRVGNRKIYPTSEAAADAFQLSPPQPADRDKVLALAYKSMRAVEGGWRWKFDPNIAIATPLMLVDIADKLTLPIAVIHGSESGVVSAQNAASAVALLPKGRGPYAVDGAYHHLMLDHPERVARLLLSVMESYPDN